MGFFRAWARVVTYPILRPAKDLKASVAHLKAAAAKNKAVQQARAAEADAARALMGDQTPADKFSHLTQTLGWTPEALREQAVASRRARIAMVATGVLGFFMILALIWVLPRIFMIVVAPVAIVVFAGCLALGFKYAWFEYELERQEIVPFATFMARPDLFSRLLRWR